MALAWLRVSPYCLDAVSHTVAKVCISDPDVDGARKWVYEAHRRALDPRDPSGFSRISSTKLGTFGDAISAQRVCEVDAAAAAIRGDHGEGSSGPGSAGGRGAA